MNKLTLETLERWLWDSADLMRGHIDSSYFKNYIFGLLFLKRANDQFMEEANIAVTDDSVSLEEALEDEDYHQFFIPSEAYWSELLQHFNKYSLANEHLDNPDILGSAYEYLIREFADDGGKKGGEFYTPKEVVKLVVGLIKPEAGNSVYEPTCGSGGMLIQNANDIKANGGVVGKFVDAKLYAQEKNLGTWAICQINMIVYNFKDSDIRKGDTLSAPKHLENGELMTYDRVIANPPFSYEWLSRFHEEMFGNVWDWVGKFRQVELSIGIKPYQVPTALKELADYIAYWNKNKTFDIYEIATRIHHKVVQIHPYQNGNGRWSRMLVNIY